MKLYFVLAAISLFSTSQARATCQIVEEIIDRNGAATGAFVMKNGERLECRNPHPDESGFSLVFSCTGGAILTIVTHQGAYLGGEECK